MNSDPDHYLNERCMIQTTDEAEIFAEAIVSGEADDGGD